MTPDDAWRIQSSWRSGPGRVRSPKEAAPVAQRNVSARVRSYPSHTATLQSRYAHQDSGSSPQSANQVGSSVPVITRRAARHLQDQSDQGNQSGPYDHHLRHLTGFHWSLQVSPVPPVPPVPPSLSRSAPRYAAERHKAAHATAHLRFRPGGGPSRGPRFQLCGLRLPPPSRSCGGHCKATEGDERLREQLILHYSPLVKVRRGPGPAMGAAAQCRGRPTSFRRGSSG